MSPRRREPRHVIDPLPIDLDAQVDLDPGYSDHMLSNLALGGVFVRMEHPLPVGAPVCFGVTLPTLDKPRLDVVGTVVWTRTSEQATLLGGSPGIGIRFDKVNPEGLEGLKRLIADLVGVELFSRPHYPEKKP